LQNEINIYWKLGGRQRERERKQRCWTYWAKSNANRSNDDVMFWSNYNRSNYFLEISRFLRSKLFIVTKMLRFSAW